MLTERSASCSGHKAPLPRSSKHWGAALWATRSAREGERKGALALQPDSRGTARWWRLPQRAAAASLGTARIDLVPVEPA